MAYKEQEFFHEMNQVLDKYNIRVVFFPRELTEKNKWEYGTFYIPYGVRKSKSRRYDDDDDDNPRDELDRVSYLDGVNSVNDGVDFNDYDDESYETKPLPQTKNKKSANKKSSKKKYDIEFIDL